MIAQERILELRNLIAKDLTPLVDRDYRYLMMCDHQNVGDTLIMEGEFAFLSEIRKYRCKEYTTMVSFEARHPIIPKEDLLIMRGSGSFGDIWPTAPNFWKFVMKNYPDNPILFMPQTIHFNEEQNLNEMREIIGLHKKVVLCVRDMESYKIAQKYFECESYLIPDMAFYMNPRYFRNLRNPKNDRTLVVRRSDKESKPYHLADDSLNTPAVDVSDWPTYSTYGRIEYYKVTLLKKHYYRLYDWYIKNVYRHYIIKCGLSFLAPYTNVFATRMHAGILAMMMGKKVTFLDNSYGKLSRVYNTWLQNVENVSLEA